MTEEDVLDVVTRLEAEMRGLGRLEPLLRDPRVTDVLVNNWDAVFVDRGHGLERTSVTFPSSDSVRLFAVRLASMAGRRLDEASPWVDASLPGGLRLHAVLPPIAVDGPLVSLRVVGRRAMAVAELVAAGSLSHRMAEILQQIVDCRLSFLVTGGTGSGKTTLLCALLGLVDDRHRIVLVEDTAELAPDHPHVVRLEGRPANIEGSGAVTLRDLVRQSLRMRPDRLVVGEVRGAEVVDLLAAMNTGHEGGCGTVHANEPEDLPARIEALAAPAGLPRAGVHAQLASGLDAVVHVARDPAGGRRVTRVGVLESDDGWTRISPAFDARGRELESADVLVSRLSAGRRGC